MHIDLNDLRGPVGDPEIFGYLNFLRTWNFSAFETTPPDFKLFAYPCL